MGFVLRMVVVFPFGLLVVDSYLGCLIWDLLFWVDYLWVLSWACGLLC